MLKRLYISTSMNIHGRKAGSRKRICLVVVLVIAGIYFSYHTLFCGGTPKAYMVPRNSVQYIYDAKKHAIPYDRDMPLIFIGGVPRSGTTLMRAMLDAHPLVRCGEETRVIPRILAMKSMWQKSSIESKRLIEAGLGSDVIDSAIAAFILEVIAKHGEAAPHLCNKDPFTLKSSVYLNKVFPNAKFILMIRDGRAVVHSIITRKITISGFSLTSYRQCLKKWNTAMEAMYSQCLQVGENQCLPVFYEKLVLSPDSWLRKILTFLDIEWDSKVLHHEDFIGKPGGISISNLEKKVFMLKCRNESLRSSSASMVTSHSTSPTPPSLNSYLDRTSFPDPNSNVQEGSRPCSRCSQCSSTISNSPKSDKAHGHKLSGYTYQQPSAGDNSSKQETTSSHSKPPNGITTQAVVHAASDLDTEQNITRERKNSLPEIVSEPNRELPKTSATVSKEVQCAFMPSLDCSLEERFFETMKLNSKLAEDLGVARKEIEMLKGRLKELEMNHLARQCMEQMYTEYFDVNPDVEEKISPSLPATVAKSTSSTSKFEMPNGSSKRKPAVPKKPVLTAYSSPLPGCRCSSCEEMILSAISTTMQPTSEPRKFPINPRLHIQVDDHVVVKRERTGHIRYIGHLDKIDQPNSVFVGLELDAPVGQHDGFFNGKRYFQCAKDHAIFVPFRDVLCQVKQEFLKSSYSNLPEVIQSETESDGSPQPEHQSSLGKSYKVWKVRHRKTDLCSVQNKIERNSSSMTETGAPNCSLGRRPWITECCIHSCSVPHCNYNKFNCYHIDMQENERFTGC